MCGLFFYIYYLALQCARINLYMIYLIVLTLIVFSALFSGLTLGLMSLNTYELKRKMDLGSKEAARVYKVREKGNLLLCTLLIGNVAVNATLSIYLSSITAGVTAAFIATALIVIFGEILPQSVFSRYALTLGSRTAWLVQIFIFIFYPICYPLALILDKVLGAELPTIYSKQELMKIIEEHEDSSDSTVKEEEERIVKGALTFSDKTVRTIMTPRVVVAAYGHDTIIDEKFIQSLKNTGYSRIVVYREELDTVLGIVYLKHLIGGTSLGKTLGDIADREVIYVNETRNLLDVLNAFLTSRHHLFVVISEFGNLVGIVTLEDLLEEIIGSEIMDEDDKHQDLRRLARSQLKRERRRTIQNVV